MVILTDTIIRKEIAFQLGRKSVDRPAKDNAEWWSRFSVSFVEPLIDG